MTDSKKTDTTDHPARSRVLASVIASIVATSLLTFSAVLGSAVPARSLSITAVVLAAAAAVSGLRVHALNRSRLGVFISGVFTAPLAATNPGSALVILSAAAVAVIVSLFPRRRLLMIGIAAALFAVIAASPGVEILTAAYVLFFVAASSAALSFLRDGVRASFSPAAAVGLLALVSATTVNELARRTALPGTQLSAARWGLLLLLVAATATLVSSMQAMQVLRKAVVVAIGSFVAVAMAVTPLQGTSEQLRSTDGGESILAAIAGSAGSTRMIGDEGAGPREQFKGLKFDDCDKYSIRDCLITYFDDIATQDGVQAAIDDLVEKVQNNVGMTFPTHCHQVVHNLGQLAFELTDGDFALVSSYDPQVCGTGFIHGLYEKYFNKYGSYIFTNTGEVCDKMNLVQDWYAWTCNHILGHTISTKMMTNPNVAAEFCLKLLGRAGFADCESGAWMNFWSDDVVVEWFANNAPGEPEEAFKICYGATRDAKFYCYQEIFPVLAKLSNKDLPTMARWCEEFSEPARGEGAIYLETTLDYTDRCMQGVARAVGVVSGYDYRVAMLQCAKLDELPEAQCLTGAGASVVLNTGSVTGGLEMCERVKVKGYRDYCYIWVKQVGSTLAQGPNADNMPAFGETRIPATKVEVPLPPKVTGGAQP
jgi:hypothetical protein